MMWIDFEKINSFFKKFSLPPLKLKKQFINKNKSIIIIDSSFKHL